MSIISRYVLRQFLRLTALCLAGAVTLFLIAEFIERIDDLIEKKATLLDGFLYFLLDIPQLVVFSVPITILLASVLTLILLSRSNEVVAMRACGASVYQVIAPILLASLAFSGLTFYLNDTVVPFANQRRYYIWRVRIKRIELHSYQQLDGMWYRSEDNTIWHITHYDPFTDRMSNVTLYRLDKADRLVKRIDAARAAWDPEKRVWRFRNVLVHSFSEKGIVQKRLEKAVFTLREEPADFKKIGKDPEQMTFRELRRYIRTLQKSGADPTRYVVDMWAKLSGPMVSFVLALVGIPFSLRTSRSAGVALGVATAVAIGTVYLILFYAGLSLGHAGRLPPLIAAWGPNLLFLGGGTYLLTHLRS